MASTAVEKVKVSGSLKFPFWVVPKYSEDELKGTAVVRVEAPTALKTRVSIDLVVVLDISSSGAQSTEKLSLLYLLKKALKFIITQLDDGDCLNIVAFNNLSNSYTADNDIKISSKDRKSAEKKVDELVAIEPTGSKSSLEHAVQILGARSDKNNKRQGFIVFMSDGLNNSESVWSTDDTVPNFLRTYAIHTLGLGKAHDPKEMLFIAKESNGTYSCITENLNCKIMEALAICLFGLKSIVAVDTHVEVKLKQSSMTTNLKISGIDCRGFRREGADKIFLGALYAGEVKDLIVHIEFTVKNVSGFNPIDLLAVTVKYNDTDQRKQSNSTAQCSVGVYACATSFAKDCTNEPTPFPMVLQQMARFKVLKFMDKFDKALAVLKEDAGVATKRKQGGKADDPMFQNMAAGNLERTWKEFKKTDGSLLWKEAQRIGLDLGRIEDDIDAMVSCLRRGSGLACVYSWVLSHELQRAAFTGLPATMFLTPAMKEMVQQAQEQSAEDTAMSAAAAAGSSHPPPGEGFIGKRVVQVLEQIAGSLDRREQSRNPSEAQTGRGKPGGEAKQ
ncbi:unnamed protein product [Urochloa decumbens]|uniref:VWFA domain-containing protein n=1 Tax=Urochloa decumbens TaxID=240449 RepID=A0ABC9AXJ5_9POAL